MTPIAATEDSSLAARVVASRPLAGVSGGSALVRVGGRLLAVHDDAYRVTWISLPALDMTPLVLLGGGAPLAKADKPDFESAVVTPDGILHLLGSGSTRTRCAIARVDLRGSRIELLERPEIYACIEEALELDERPNIEGAIVAGARLRLFHRGVRTPSASVDMPLRVLYGEAPRILAAHAFDLGTLDGIRLSLTDAAALSGDRTAFAATAEDTADAVSDGPVAGSAIGMLESTDARPAARWTRLLAADGRPFPAKVEGLVIDGDLGAGWLLTDADDPNEPALLARVTLEGFA